MRQFLFYLLSTTLLSTTFAQTTLSPELMLRLKRVSEPSLSPDGKTILYVVETMDLDKNKGNKAIYSISIDGGVAKQLTSGNEDEQVPHWMPDGKSISYVCKNNEHWQQMDANGQQVELIENSGMGFISFAFASNLVAYSSAYLAPSNESSNEPLSSAKIIDNLFYRYWSAWDDGSNTHLQLAELIDGKLNANSKIDIQANEPFNAEDFDLSKDGKYIAYSCKKLRGKEFAQSTNNDIYLYSIANKTTVNISEGLPGYDLNPKFSPDGKKVCWTSMPTNGCESDISNLMYYDLASRKVACYIKDIGERIDQFAWSVDTKFIYFLMEKEGTVQIFSFDYFTRKVKQITYGQQEYSTLSISGNYAVTLKSSFSMPDELVKVNLKTGEETQLTYTNKEILDNVKFGKVEGNWIKTSDDKKVQTWVFFPPDFDATKKYPAILYCQGGPEVGITQAFSYRWNLQLMCSNGYIVVAPNRRGVPGFGKEWKDAISKDWGGQSISDYLSAIDSISKRSYVDVTRIGAVGASYGGYSVYWLEGHNQNHRFKTFIAHCGVFNFESWYTTTDQTFFGTYELGGTFWEKSLPKSYLNYSPHKYIDNWDTPILVIHNERDFRVPVSEGMQAFGAAQLKNIKSRFLYFPDEGHWVLKPRNSLVWHHEFYRWLKETL